MTKRFSDSSPPMNGAVAVPSPVVGWSWVRQQLDEKANKETVLALFEGVKNEVLDARGIALSAIEKAEKPHTCTQEKVIDKMDFEQQEIKNMLRIRGFVNIGTIIAVVSALVAAIAFFIRLETTVEVVSKGMEETKAIVNKGTIASAKVETKNVEMQREVAKFFLSELDKREEMKRAMAEEAKRLKKVQK